MVTMISVSASRRFAVALLAFGFGILSRAMAEQPTLGFMHGVWVGEGTQLSLDTERMLANVDPTKPFQWNPLIIRNISDGMVTFWIAERRFIGMFEGEKLSLAGEALGSTIKMERRRH
jgi:hypothetical protein